MSEYSRLVLLDRSRDGEECVRLSSTSNVAWQCLEVCDFGRLDLVISDVDSFVRDTGSFTFMSERWQGVSQWLILDVQEACSRYGKACHVVEHCRKQGGEHWRYITLSTSQEVARRCPAISVENDGEATREAMASCIPCITLGPSQPPKATITVGDTLVNVTSDNLWL